MTINRIVLRKKSSMLLNMPGVQMDLEIDNPDVNILNQEKNILYLVKSFMLKITDKEKQLTVASFEIIFQSEVQLHEEEVFSNTDFTRMLLPMIYMQLNSMIGEMPLPKIDLQQFSALINKG
ncbi:MAG: hypothetical protein MSH65_02745 [Spirochaetia bacterium]|nr:hypothetical protein [Spirochaetia bacterium]MDY5819548.1 hypothetical protein [Treponema sp.]